MAGPLYVATVTLQNLAHTQRLVECIKKAEKSIPLRLVIVDNGSTDGTLDWAEQFKAVQVIKNEQNIGATGGWNQAIKFAVSNGADSVLVCGNDTAPMDGVIERLYDLVTKGVPFITGTSVAYDQPDVHIPLGTEAEPLVVAPDFSFFMFKPKVVCEVVGAWDVQIEYLRRKQWEVEHPNEPLAPFQNPWCYGLFDERYHTYFEDNDYHWRMQQAGLVALRDPGALVRHDCSLTIRSVTSAGAENRERFPRNLQFFKSKWGASPAELNIPQARPLNVSDSEWLAMGGGRPIVEVDRQRMAEEARKVYGQYGA